MNMEVLMVVRMLVRFDDCYDSDGGDDEDDDYGGDNNHGDDCTIRTMMTTMPMMM